MEITGFELFCCSLCPHAVSAHAMAGAEDRARASGCDDYLPKPIDEERLATMVREWIVRGRERR